MSNNPTNKTAVPAKSVDNGGTFGEILQPVNQRAFRADATDLATVLVLANGLKADLIALGLMKSS